MPRGVTEHQEEFENNYGVDVENGCLPVLQVISSAFSLDGQQLQIRNSSDDPPHIILPRPMPYLLTGIKIK